MGNSLQSYGCESRMALWSKRVSACRSSELSVRKWCLENDINEKSYYYWQRKLYTVLTQNEPQFIEVPKPGQGSAVAATIQLGDASVDIYNGATGETITALVQALRSC